jgi:hypothetical protein
MTSFFNMTFQYTGTNAKLLAAVQDPNRILADPTFFQQVTAMSVFAYSTYNGAQVASGMQGLTRSIEIDTYWNPLSGATAKTQTTININTAKSNQRNASIVNTLIHESVHFTDWAVTGKWDYTDRNVFELPPISGPYSIGALAESLATP